MIYPIDDRLAQMASQRRRRWPRLVVHAALLTVGIFLVGMRTTQVALTLVSAYYVYWLTRSE